MKRFLLLPAFLLPCAPLFAAGMQAPAAATVSVTKVEPRIFSPLESDAAVNRVRFYIDNPGSSEISARIFDASGALVCRNISRESDNILFWDGRDRDGAYVQGGVYIYQIEADAKIINGTIVVAR